MFELRKNLPVSRTYQHKFLKVRIICNISSNFLQLSMKFETIMLQIVFDCEMSVQQGAGII